LLLKHDLFGKPLRTFSGSCFRLADDAASNRDEGQQSSDDELMNGKAMRERSVSTAAPTALPS
jgi:hypothetical protein